MNLKTSLQELNDCIQLSIICKWSDKVEVCEISETMLLRENDFELMLVENDGADDKMKNLQGRSCGSLIEHSAMLAEEFANEICKTEVD